MADLAKAFAAEKLGATITTVILERARANRIEYKLLALGVSEQLPADPNETVAERADRLEAAFRQRIRQHRRRLGVIRDHELLGDGGADHPARSKAMTHPYGKPTFIRERDIYYGGNLPPDVAPPPPDDDDEDDDEPALGRGAELVGDDDLDGDDEDEDDEDE